MDGLDAGSSMVATSALTRRCRLVVRDIRAPRGSGGGATAAWEWNANWLAGAPTGDVPKHLGNCLTVVAFRG